MSGNPHAGVAAFLLSHISTDMTASTASMAPQYARLLKEMSSGLRSYRHLVEPQIVEDMLKDPQFGRGFPYAEREHQARKIVERNISALIKLGASFVALVFLLLNVVPAPAHAMQPEEFAMPAARVETTDARRLAGIVCAEACGQPWPARVAIAQIVAREAAGRGMTIVELSEQTWFVSVYRYAVAHPDSWHARQFAEPPAWALELADDVLAGRLPAVLPGYGHFDGQSHGGLELVIGQAYFRP